MLKDNVGASGRLTLKLYDADGILKDAREVNNLVVITGRSFIAQSIVRNPLPTALSHMGVGTAIMPVTSYTGNGTTAVTVTVSTANAAQLQNGNQVTIEGASGTEQLKLNGTWTISSLNTGAGTFVITVGTAVTAGTYTTTVGSLYIRAGLANTSLIGELGTRDGLDSNTNTTSSGGTSLDSASMVSTFAAGNATGAIREAGIFNASTGGTMLCRTYFDVINKGALDSLKITWAIKISSS